MNRLILVGAVVLGIAPLSHRAHAQSAENVAQRALPHVMTLRVFDTNGTEVALGSGFVMKDGRVVTNAHVVAGASWIELFASDGTYLGNVSHAEAISTRLDLVVLPKIVGRTDGLALAPELPSVGESVWVIGSPQGLEGSVSTGVVSAIRESSGKTYIQISAPISEGSSGGPVLNDDAEVVAVAVGLIPDGQNLNFAIPSTDLARLASGQGGRHSFPTRLDDSGTASGSPANDLPQWIYLDRAPSGADHFIQGKGQLTEGDIVWAWLRVLYPVPQATDLYDGSYDESRIYAAFDCARRYHIYLEFSQHRDGQTVFGWKSRDPEWRAVQPGLFSETVFEVACGQVDIAPYLNKRPGPR